MSVTITAKVHKQKASSYKGNLEINNNSSKTYTKWGLSYDLSTGTTVNSKDFTVSSNMLIPSSKIAILDPNTDIKTKIEGNGQFPTNFMFVDMSILPVPPVVPTGFTGPTGPDGPVNYLYNLQMTDLTDISQVESAGFNFQYSYDQNTTPVNSKYFTISQPNGLEINIYSSDKPFKQGNTTFPRSELRGTAVILDNVKYTLIFDQFIVNAPTFDFCFVQIFGGKGPNLIVRYRKGVYELLSDAGIHKQFSFKSGIQPSELVGKWTNWKIEFLLDNSSGYTKVYRDSTLEVDTGPGNNSGNNNSYLKLGLYAQQMKPSNDVKEYIKNLYLYS